MANHVFRVREEPRLLEPGVLGASHGVALGLSRERMLAGLWAGDGLPVCKTTVAGAGLVAINAPGPVEVAEVEETDLRVQGRLVLGRTASASPRNGRRRSRGASSPASAG